MNTITAILENDAFYVLLPISTTWFPKFQMTTYSAFVQVMATEQFTAACMIHILTLNC